MKPISTSPKIGKESRRRRKSPWRLGQRYVRKRDSRRPPEFPTTSSWPSWLPTTESPTGSSSSRRRWNRGLWKTCQSANFTANARRRRRSQWVRGVIEEGMVLEKISLDLLRAQFPVRKGIRLLGISLSALSSAGIVGAEQLPLGI